MISTNMHQEACMPHHNRVNFITVLYYNLYINFRGKNMACTTILVGKKASYDGSTIIARNDDSPSGIFCAKKLVVINPKDQPVVYKSKIGHLSMILPNKAMRYTATPSVDATHGIWAAAGINEDNVAMTATETITTNDRVLAADPLVEYSPKKGNKPRQLGGIGEEDLVYITLPYIHSAKEGVIRLGSLLEKYGTYESNGIAFSDKEEIWWLESIGGHHWIAKRVRDDSYITMPNQFGLDEFDLEDAFNKQKENLCSSDLKEFIDNNHLNLNKDNKFNPRLAFGSHSDSDHVYNTPRAWYIERYFNPRTYVWDGENAKYTPISDDIPWSMVPERKITISDVKYILSSHYQGTPYDPYARFGEDKQKGMYRPIGISRTDSLVLAQIRGYMPKDFMSIEWLAFGSNAFNAIVPLFPNVSKMPKYFSNTTNIANTNNFYWSNRLIGALSDSHYQFCSSLIENFQETIQSKGFEIIKKYEKIKDSKLFEKANNEIAKMVEEETNKLLDDVLYQASCHMKNGYSKSDK